jgi:hypothetical protein
MSSSTTESTESNKSNDFLASASNSTIVSFILDAQKEALTEQLQLILDITLSGFKNTITNYIEQRNNDYVQSLYNKDKGIINEATLFNVKFSTKKFSTEKSVYCHIQNGKDKIIVIDDESVFNVVTAGTYSDGRERLNWYISNKFAISINHNNYGSDEYRYYEHKIPIHMLKVIKDANDGGNHGGGEKFIVQMINDSLNNPLLFHSNAQDFEAICEQEYAEINKIKQDLLTKSTNLDELTATERKNADHYNYLDKCVQEIADSTGKLNEQKKMLRFANEKMKKIKREFELEKERFEKEKAQFYNQQETLNLDEYLLSTDDDTIWSIEESDESVDNVPIHILEKNLDKVDWSELSKNPNAIRILEKNLDKVNWYMLSKNPNAIHILEKNLDGVDWYMLSSNPNAIHIIEKNLDKVYLHWLSSNPNAIHILEKNLDKVNWDWLSSNPNAIHILEKNLDKVNWYALSSNPNAIHILEKNLDKVDWIELSSNPNAIHILEKNLDEVEWYGLSSNPNAIHMIEKNLDEVDWDMLSANPNAIHILEKNMDKINWKWLSAGGYPI